jgi:hypothetical protein
MAELPLFRPTLADRVEVLGFHSPGDGGGGVFRWQRGAVDGPITGMVVPSKVDSGCWVREDESEVTDRMAGARIDGRTIDDEALQALAQWVMRSSCRRVVFVDGVRRVLAPDARATPFHVRGVDDLILVFDDCEFQIAADQQTGTGTVFDFRSCQRVRTIGTPRFRGNLTVEAIRRTTGFKGSWAMQFQDNCSFADVSVDCEGMGGTINFHRFPRICVDVSTHPVVVESGRGYRRGDEIRLTAIGVPATVQPIWRVDQIGPDGRIARLALIERGEFPHDRARAGLRTRETGFPAVGGSGSGVKIIPYMADLDAIALDNKSRSIRCTTRAVRCIYGLHWIYGVDDSRFLVDADYVFRAFTCYGGNWRNRGTIRQRNTCADSFAGGSAMGLGYEMEVKMVQLPTSATGFWFSGSQCRVSFSSGLPARCILDLELAVDLPAGRNEAGALLEVEKAALDGTDVIHSRGHIGEFTIRGRVRGRGKGPSGLRADAIIGTNYDIPGTAYARERFTWRFADGFDSAGGGDIELDLASLERLEVGDVRIDGALRADPRGEGPARALGMAVSVHANADIGRLEIR